MNNKIEFQEIKNTTSIRVEFNTILLGEILEEIHGEYVFYPSLCDSSYWDEYILGEIISKLKELNKPSC